MPEHLMITSPHNQRLKALRKLHDRKHRERERLFFAEGEDMLVEALRWGACPKTVFYDPDELDVDTSILQDVPPEAELIAVQRDVLRASGALGSGSRLIGVWPQATAVPLTAERVVVYLHEVSDPGNVGSVLRSALALVPSLVVISPGTADPFGPKAVRASMGAIFGQAIAHASFDDLRAHLAGARLVGLAPRAGKELRQVDLGAPVVLCLGSERHGLPGEVLASCDDVCHVPLQAGGAESLNVAMAATLCLYEAANQMRNILVRIP
jgi:TrmH family RNA methyltransferase